ncbi:DUF4123 domain-containing protein [Cupriavidus plantarum]|uniref:DUF4123 domain-containing protein n=1 Tax=Cupriavidus plantarum TaxID=942865 RepID=UPI000EB2461A|nr:DUF4123 domain-containing protein [Cupriavidus plantarum]RLK31666.1 uncharacterized protein DUF4123 [Cupriavidus plantarum]
MFDLYHRFLDDFTHILLNPLRLGRDTLDDLPLVPVIPERLADSADLMPVVVRLDAIPRARKIRLIEDARAWREEFRSPYFNACLVCPETTAEHLAVQLARNLVVAAPSAKRFLLRFDDPNVLTQLLRIFDDARLDALMGTVTAWHWEDPLGKVRTRLRGATPPVRLAIAPPQWPALHRVGLVNQCLKQLLRDDALPEGDAVTIGRALDDALLVAASRHRLKDADDRRLYAMQHVSRGVPPESDPQLHDALARAASGEISYVGACAALHEDPVTLATSDAD